MYAQFFQLFILMALGFGARRLNLIDSRMNSGLNNLIVYLFFPCLIVNSLATLKMTGEMVLTFFEMFAVAAVLFALFIFLTDRYLRVRKYKNGTTLETDVYPSAFANAVTPNSGFFGYPITVIFFGAEGLFFLIPQNVVMMIMLLTIVRNRFRDPEAVRNMTPEEKAKRRRKTLFQPYLIGAIIGLLLSVTGIGLPGMLSDIFTTVGNLAAPLAMIFTGAILAESKELFPATEVPVILETCLARLVLIPAITLGFCLLAVRFLGFTPLMASVTVLGMACPAAVLVASFAAENNRNSRLSGWIIVLSTVFSMLTVPLWVKLLEHLF